MSKFGFLTPKPKPRKPNTTSAQRTYGKGRGRGLRTGRAEGALAGGAAVGFTYSHLLSNTTFCFCYFSFCSIFSSFSCLY